MPFPLQASIAVQRIYPYLVAQVVRMPSYMLATQLMPLDYQPKNYLIDAGQFPLGSHFPRTLQPLQHRRQGLRDRRQWRRPPQPSPMLYPKPGKPQTRGQLDH